MLRVFVAALAVVGTTAVAQVSTMVNNRPDGPNNNPNQIVCISETVTGSRIGARRVCRTRAEWVEHREETRKTIERVQYFKPTCGQGSSADCLPVGLRGN
jgi:hypothetical protein